MRDYVQIPIHSDTLYSLYLIKNEAGLNEIILESIDQIINQKRLIVSFERLYKGSKQALVVYGPVVVLKEFADTLNLMELEDYSLKYKDKLPSRILSWEISSKKIDNNEKISLDLNKIIDLHDNEEIWWQLVIQPKCEKNGLQPLFKVLIRVTVIADNDNRARDIKSKIDELIKKVNLLPIPQQYSTAQVIKFYQKRSLPQKSLSKEGGHFIAAIDNVKDLLS